RAVRYELADLLRQEMRQLRSPSEQPYFAKTVDYLNLIFGHSEASQKHWEECLRPILATRFPSSLDHIDEKVSLKAEIEAIQPAKADEGERGGEGPPS